MLVIKLEIRLREIPQAIAAFKKSRREALVMLSEGIRTSVSEGFNQMLNTEIDVFLGEKEQTDNKRNGYHPERKYVLKGVGAIKIRVPKDRRGLFQSVVIPAKERVDPRIKEEMAACRLVNADTCNDFKTSFRR